MKIAVRRLVPCRLPLKRWQLLAEQALRLAAPKGYTLDELSVVIVGRSAMRKMNNEYRGKNAETDVLSFDYGELIICAPVAEAQAKEHSLSLADELSLLFVHGLLHIMGYDHEQPGDRKEMMKLEQQLLGFSGLVGIAHS